MTNWGGDTGSEWQPGQPLGTRLGRYELLERLAMGGMAEIHLARDCKTGKLVVVKRAHASVMKRPDLRRMFVDEARIAEQLVHPNIVRCLDVEDAASHCYYVMEYLDGLDAFELIAHEYKTHTQVPLEHALLIAISAADALQAAHEQCAPDGTPLCIVHRDVSPCNIHVGRDGRVCLLDFGVARAELEGRIGTVVGQIKGKLSYMAPEHVRGEAEARSDIYSLGVALYEMTVGRKLFPVRAGSQPELHRQRRIVRPSELLASYPRHLETIVLKALAPDVRYRYRSAAELATALRAFAAYHGCELSTAKLADYVHRCAAARQEPAAGDECEAVVLVSANLVHQERSIPALESPDTVIELMDADLVSLDASVVTDLADASESATPC